MRIDRWFIGSALLGLLSSTSALAEDDKGDKEKVKLPKAVAKVWKAKYPMAKLVGASKEKDQEGETVYEVELIVKGKTVDLIIDEEGEIEETEKEISPSDLPTAVTKAISKAFPKAKIEKAEELTLEDDKVLYEVVLKFKGEASKEVVFVPNGKLLKPEGEEDEDDEKPKAKKKDMDDDEDEDDEKPKAKKKDMDDEEDDEKPKAKKKDMDDDDDDEKPKAKKKDMDDDDEDDEKPKAKKKDTDDEEEDEPDATIVMAERE